MAVADRLRLQAEVRERVASEVARWMAALESDGRPPSEDDRRVFTAGRVAAALEEVASGALRRGEPPMTAAAEEEVRRAVMRSLTDPTAPFSHLLELPGITDIAINGWRDVRTSTADGRQQRHPPFCGSDAELIEIFQQVARRGDQVERSWTPTTPELDLYLERWQARVGAIAWVCDPVAVSIRMHPHVHTSLDDLVGLGMLDAGLASLFRACNAARLNGVIAGGTGAGKTTLMRSILHECDPDERLWVIESEPELHLDRDPRHNQVIVGFERKPNAEGRGGYTIEQHARAVKRHNPGRIAVGEVRGPEVVPMLEIMSLGVDGSLCTIHSRDTASVFARMAVFARQAPGDWTREAVFELIGLAVDYVVLCRRLPDGRRVVAEVRHVEGYEPRSQTMITNPVFVPGPGGRAVPNPAVPFGEDLQRLLEEHGYDPSRHRPLGAAS